MGVCTHYIRILANSQIFLDGIAGSVWIALFLSFFDWGSDGSTDHVGIVEKCENGTVYTVEGNSGDACKQQSYPVGSGSIYGYGCPNY